jgi:hypothetical protein
MKEYVQDAMITTNCGASDVGKSCFVAEGNRERRMGIARMHYGPSEIAMRWSRSQLYQAT